ncbi:hypothetical protein DPMN_033751 [Dreissena polymorpha]|uniref:Uncharacterized protein n=1 Tax=Dreissena polymorpha TaxID=45954 RepID=A0A9D4M5F9_DREPO|nr:hypothetical protein DPMN_033751 [Dreissena polymorpha]
MLFVTGTQYVTETGPTLVHRLTAIENPHAQHAPNVRCKEDRSSSNSSAPSALASDTGIIHKVVEPPPVSSANHFLRRSQSVTPTPPRAVRTRIHSHLQMKFNANGVNKLLKFYVLLLPFDNQQII